MTERHVETIFCDDIRQEVSNKQSFIGVYTGKLYVAEFPTTLPKLCLEIKVLSPIEKPIEFLKVEVLIDDEVFQEVTIDRDNLINGVQRPDESEDGDDEYHTQILMLQMVFSPITFKEKCHIKVRVLTEDEELIGSGLRVALLPADYLKKLNLPKK